MSPYARRKRKRTRRLAGVAILWILVVAVLFSGPRPVFSIPLPDGTDYPVRPITLDVSDRDAVWREAGRRYRAGHYTEAAQLFEQLEAGGDLAARHEAALFLGISLLLNARPAEARASLERARALAGQIGMLGDAGDFYLGLAALAEDDIDTATSLFEAAAGGRFDSDTRLLLTALRNP